MYVALLSPKIKYLTLSLFLLSNCLTLQAAMAAQQTVTSATVTTTPATQTTITTPITTTTTTPATQTTITAPVTTSISPVTTSTATTVTPNQNMSVGQFEQLLQTNINPNPPPTAIQTTTTTTNTTNPTLIGQMPPQTVVVSNRPINPVSDIVPERKQVRGPARKYRPLTYEESLAVMLRSAPPALVPQSEDADIAFNQLLQQNIPLSPQQVVQLRQQIDAAQRAAAITPVIPPKPVSSTIMINLAPGTTPPAVRLAQGYVSSLLFVDSTGAPWPIAAFDVGNPKAVNIQWDGKSNILLLQAVNPYSNGDIVIRLVGLPTPITLELVSGQRVVDYRVDIHVSGIGPNTKELPTGTALPNSASQLLLGVLDGVAPPGSRFLTIRGADAQAWLLGERMYLRTRFTVLSPGWISTMVSSDGMHAYEMPRTSSVLISRYGEPAELRVEGF